MAAEKGRDRWVCSGVVIGNYSWARRMGEKTRRRAARMTLRAGDEFKTRTGAADQRKFGEFPVLCAAAGVRDDY